MEVIALATVLGSGYLLSQNARAKDTEAKEIVPPNERPNGKNIMNADDRVQKTFTSSVIRSTQKWLKSLNPDKTGVIGPVYKDQVQNNKIEKPIYRKSENIIQKESALRYSIPTTTPTHPNNSKTVEEISDNLMNYDYIVDEGTKPLNERRHRMENPTFSPYKKQTLGEPTVYKTNYSTGRQVRVFENGHNNMEPFFGGSVKQNMQDDANRTKLEAFTGTNPVFKHKKEVDYMFKLHETKPIQGTPVQMNREEERYVMGTAQTKQNILPFEQKRVTPGLNLKYEENTMNTGFQDKFRPLGGGIYQSIDKIKVNPKVSYKGRIVGEGYYVSKGQMRQEVSKNKPEDLIFSNFVPASAGKSTNQYAVRPMLEQGAEVRKATVNDKDTVILHGTQRDEYGYKNADHVGPATNGSSLQYVYDKDRWVPKTTLKDQTQDNIHQRINRTGPTRRQTNPYDRARTTIKEQTMVEDYIGGANGNAGGASAQMDRTQYDNAVINGLREQTVPNRAPVPQGVKAIPDKSVYKNLDHKKIQYDTTQQQRVITKITQPSTGRTTFGEITKQGGQYDDSGLLCDRLEQYNVAAFKQNPYTQSLHSYDRPTNPAYEKTVRS